MRPLPLLALLCAASATAGELNVEKSGMLPAFAWVDGQDQGKLKNKGGLSVQLADGPHELWIAIENGGTVTRCHGLFDVGPSGANVQVSDKGCGGLSPGFGDPTAFRGSSVDFSLNGSVDAWVSVDGGQALALPSKPFLLNLTPGSHTIVLYTDVMKSSVFAQGNVTLAAGERLPVTCTSGGCVGFDQPPVVIDLFGAAAALVNAAASAAVGEAGAPSSGAPSGSAAPSSGGGSADLTCCVNGAFYDCPSVGAVKACSGDFMACMMSCGMTDFGCTDRCLEEHPPDPSQCNRSAAKDATCK